MRVLAGSLLCPTASSLRPLVLLPPAGTAAALHALLCWGPPPGPPAGGEGALAFPLGKGPLPQCGAQGGRPHAWAPTAAWPPCPPHPFALPCELARRRPRPGWHSLAHLRACGRRRGTVRSVSRGHFLTRHSESHPPRPRPVWPPHRVYPGPEPGRPVPRSPALPRSARPRPPALALNECKEMGNAAGILSFTAFLKMRFL